MRGLLGLLGAIAAIALLAADASAASGALTQLPGLAACVSHDGSEGACAAQATLAGTRAIALSPDGRNAYVVASQARAVTVFDRDGASGALTAKAGTAGCVSEDGSAGACTDGVALSFPFSVAVSPDGTSVYVGSAGEIAIFDRDRSTGALTQKPGTAGCVSTSGSGGACATARGLIDYTHVTVSPDGRNVYATSMSANFIGAGDGAVAIFDRDPATGALTQPPGQAGCIAVHNGGPSCAPGRALSAAYAVAVSPDGRSVYVASWISYAVAIFDRDPDTGALTQKPGTAGCVTATASSNDEGCATGAGFTGPTGVLVSPDDTSVYVVSVGVSYGSAAVAVLDRDPASGGLTQKAGQAGCISSDGSGGACADATAIEGANAIAISADATSVYVAGTSSLAVFGRQLGGGALTQLAGTDGCVSQDGTGGACTTGVALEGANGVAVTPDGASAYAAAWPGATDRGAVAAFAREHPADTVAPQTAITSGPGEGSVTSDATPTFGFASSELSSTFACSLDGGAPRWCALAFTTPALAEGRHTLSVVATDGAGNADPTPATRRFSFDPNPVSPPPPPPPPEPPPPAAAPPPPPADPPAPEEPPEPARPPRPGCLVDGVDTVATDADDVVTGSRAADVMFGLAGDDVLRSFAGSDCLYGGAGDDGLDGGSGPDRLFGGPGNDRLHGGPGADRLLDDAGRDAFDGGPGDDRIDARDATPRGRRTPDRIRCGAGARDAVTADRRDRVASDCERVRRR